MRYVILPRRFGHNNFLRCYGRLAQLCSPIPQPQVGRALGREQAHVLPRRYAQQLDETVSGVGTLEYVTNASHVSTRDFTRDSSSVLRAQWTLSEGALLACEAPPRHPPLKAASMTSACRTGVRLPGRACFLWGWAVCTSDRLNPWSCTVISKATMGQSGHGRDRDQQRGPRHFGDRASRYPLSRIGDSIFLPSHDLRIGRDASLARPSGCIA